MNPYRGNKDAIRIGDSAFNQNCARCHGLGGVSGGIAPDLRLLDINDDDTDEFFIGKVRNGVTRNGAVHASLRRHADPGGDVGHPRLAGDRP